MKKRLCTDYVPNYKQKIEEQWDKEFRSRKE